MKILFFGLGNPGAQYDNTRHNFGKMCLEAYAQKHDLEWRNFNNRGQYCKFNKNDNEIYLLITSAIYMNDSGVLLKEFMNYFKLNNDEVIILHDELYFDLGTFKLKITGSGGGHNGLKNIAKLLNTKDFKRIRLGITKNRDSLADYVIGKFNTKELIVAKQIIEIINNEIIDELINNKEFNSLMNKYNAKK